MQSFAKPFTKQIKLPAQAVEAANGVLASADLHRYQSGDAHPDPVATLEADFAAWQGARFCLAVGSGGQALQLAMRAVGVQTGEQVLTNAFTLAPVPGAIRAVGGVPVLVEVTRNLVIDVDDLRSKARASGARVLMLSHMRGHLVDMDALRSVAQESSLTVIEDCAHTMGATWRGSKSGNFGRVGCFSTQSYKHMNSGEGGLLTSDDPDVMARAIILSGSYMNYAKHGAAPAEAHFTKAKYDMPNMSARMDALRAAILIPQLEVLDRSIETWNRLCDAVSEGLANDVLVRLPTAPASAQRVGSSIQFSIPGFDETQCLAFLDTAAKIGVELKWFGRKEPLGFTSTYQNWHYIAACALPQTDAVLSTLFDMRLPLSFDENDCRHLADLISDAAASTLAAERQT